MPEHVQPNCSLCANEKKMPTSRETQPHGKQLEREALLRFQPSPLSQRPHAASNPHRLRGGSEPEMSLPPFSVELSSHQRTHPHPHTPQVGKKQAAGHPEIMGKLSPQKTLHVFRALPTTSQRKE